MKNDEPDLSSIKVKQALYSWCASLYIYGPSIKLLEPLFDSNMMETLTSAFCDATYQKVVKELAAYVKSTSMVNLKNEFNQLFVVPIKGSYVPPYESCFRERKGSDMGKLLGETTRDVVKFYFEAGCKLRDIEGIFAPDHIGVELAFVAKLYANELQFLEENDLEQAKKIKNLRKSFLQKHLSKWIEDFSKAVSVKSSAFFYKHLSALTTYLVYSDLKNS